MNRYDAINYILWLGLITLVIWLYFFAIPHYRP